MIGIAVLGPVRGAAGDGTLVSVGSRRQCVLLTMLVSRLGRVVTGDELVDVLWGEHLPDHPAAALQSQVFRLRRQLRLAGVEVETDGAGYRLVARKEQLDASRFEDLVARAVASRSEPAVAVGLFDEASGLWRGRAYLEVADQEAVHAEATRLEEMRADAAEQRAAVLLELGDPSGAASATEVLMGEHPFREGPVPIRMRALALAGPRRGRSRISRLPIASRRGARLGPVARTGRLEGEILRHERRQCRGSARRATRWSAGKSTCPRPSRVSTGAGW